MGESGRLSAREVEILELVAEGLTNREIARQFWVTESTVRVHLSRVYRKIGVTTGLRRRSGGGTSSRRPLRNHANSDFFRHR